jgi:hypothetical protein
MENNIFPDSMKSKNEECSPESVAKNLSYFQDQLHLAHWQTQSYAEHMALGSLYDYVFTFKDGVVEKIMGYTEQRPKAFAPKPLMDNCNCMQVVRELMAYSDKMGMWANNKGYSDIKNMADELSGQAAKTLYLLTLT